MSRALAIRSSLEEVLAALGQAARSVGEPPVTVLKSKLTDLVAQVSELRINVGREALDVTCATDVHGAYAPGPPRLTLHMRGFWARDVGWPNAGDVMEFDHVVNGQRIQGDVIVTRMEVGAAVHSAMTVDITAVGVGPFTVTPCAADEPAAIASTRAIALGGVW